MGPLTSTNLFVCRSASAILTMAGIFTLATTLGFAATPGPETIQATYSQGGNTTGITLIVYSYSTPTELHVLSQAFEKGQDRELAIALSRTRAVGRCVIAGGVGYDVAFIQVVLTPTGRQVTFITSRPHPSDDSEPPATPQTFDLTVGQFDLNEIDPTKSTGFLFPASKLVVGEQGAFHYDLAGVPWALVNILYSNETPQPTGPQVADASGPKLGSDHSASSGH
jgi:hypothetical protein